MPYKPGLVGLILVSCLALVSGCIGNSPQAEHTFAQLPDQNEQARRRDKPGLAATDRLNNQLSQRDLAEKLALTMVDPGIEEPLAGFGFFPGRHDGYAVFRDGSAFYLGMYGKMVPLDKLASRIDRVVLAGPQKRHVVGLSPRGTHSSWNTANLTQQLVLGPQQTTFSQRRTFDAEPVSGEYLASAAEDGWLELWSLRSGNQVRAVHLAGAQPRVIAPDSAASEIIFGTDTGEVRVWDENSTTRLLYSHAGPVLEIKILNNHGLIVSASKDGTVKVYDRRQGILVQQMTFPRAAYQLHVSPDERYVIAVPATGEAQVFYPGSGQVRELWGYSSRLISRVEFASTGHAVALADGNQMRRWNLHLGTGVPPFGPKNDAEVSDFAVAAAQDLAIMASEDKQIEYYRLRENRSVGTAVTSETAITSVRASDDGKWLLMSLEDGQIARIRIDASQEIALELE